MFPARGHLAEFFHFISRAIAFVFMAAFLTLFGPGFCLIGWERIAVECQRDGHNINCQSTSGYLFNLIKFSRSVTGVQGAGQATYQSGRPGRGTPMSKIVFHTTSGEVGLTAFSSNFGDSQKWGMVDKIDRFVMSEEPTLSTTENIVCTPFLFFGIPCTFLLLGLFMSPFYGKRKEKAEIHQAVIHQWTGVPSGKLIIRAGNDLKSQLAVLMDPSPEPEQLPLVLVQGLPLLQKVAQKAILGLAAIIVGQLALLAAGVLSTWTEVVLPLMLLGGAVKLNQIRTVTLEQYKVSVHTEGWFSPKPWTEAMSEFSEIQVKEDKNDKRVLYRATLLHRTDKRRNLPLWRPALTGRVRAKERADAYQRLLGIPVTFL